MNDINTIINVLTAPVCPRCEGFIPNNDQPGAYPGALSRADNATYVCSACGTEEAMIQFHARGHVYAVDTWPLWRYDNPVVADCWRRREARLKKIGEIALPAFCDECGRVFDLGDAADADEFFSGHDCE